MDSIDVIVEHEDEFYGPITDIYSKKFISHEFSWSIIQSDQRCSMREVFRRWINRNNFRFMETLGKELAFRVYTNLFVLVCSYPVALIHF